MIPAYLWYVAFLAVGFGGGAIIMLLLAGSFGRTYLKAHLLKRTFAAIFRESRWIDGKTFKGKYFTQGKKEIYKFNPERIYITRDKVPVTVFPEYSALNIGPKDAVNVDWSKLKKEIEGHIPTPSELAYITSAIAKAREPLPTLEEKPKLNILLIIVALVVIVVVVFLLRNLGVF